MKQTVLVIDDNSDDVLITTMILSRIEPDVKVEAELSGEAGLVFLRDAEELPFLVLLDLKMPGMSGFDVLDRIRADGRLHNLPVVVVTSSSLESDKRESFAHGADEYLQKAVDIDDFNKNIGDLLKKFLRNRAANGV